MKREYKAPYAEAVLIAKEDILTLSGNTSLTATLDDGPAIGFGDFN